QDTLLCRHCGKNRVMVTRYSEGYGTEDGVLSEPQRDSDADADIEDTDCLQKPGTLQRISSRRRKRPQVARQDTTESEDDGGRSHKSHRWNLRLSPDRSHSRTILEESVSQVRPLVISQPNADGQKSREEDTGSSKLKRLWSSALSAPLILLLALSVFIVIVFFLLPWTRA
uniref:Si:ch211-63p21.1 n=1 Tax=Oryzias melastigma TaxID=30732 RepID=A0A3B3CLD7_ORYME